MVAAPFSTWLDNARDCGRLPVSISEFGLISGGARLQHNVLRLVLSL
jgi:hypothetical protein